MNSFLKTVSALFLLALAGCSPRPADNAPTGDGLKPLSAAERAQDYDQLLMLFKSYYGPYQYKESRFGFKIDDVHAALKAQAVASTSDEEFAGAVMKFGAQLHDSHVQIVVSNTSGGVATYTVPVVITPIEDRAIIADVKKETAETYDLEVGDEVLKIDGRAPFDYLPTILKYRASANPLSDKHFIFYALSRPSYMTELTPTRNAVRLAIRKIDGSEKTVELTWQMKTYSENRRALLPPAHLDLSVAVAEDINGVIAYRQQMGQVDPIFINEKSQEQYNFVKVYPSDSARKALGLANDEKPPIYAALYRYNGKTILLMRQATYSPKDYKSDVYLKAYQALMKEYQPLADVLVLDQTHNPGGSYCGSFYDLFGRDNDHQAVQYMRADRKWINDLLFGTEDDPSPTTPDEARLYTSWALQIEKAYDQGRFLSEAIPLFTNSPYVQPQAVTWTKPMLLLIDELAGSCGDLFPMLVKANGRAKLFGQRTMGAGGNVEEVGVLPNSQIHIRLTRGLFFPFSPDRGPNPGEFVENNGVTPDVLYTHTVKDVRAGYIDYIKAFTEEALRQEISP